MQRQALLQQMNLRLPVVASPMFLVSQLDLVKACVREGIIGTFPALNQRSTEGFEAWLVELKAYFAQLEQETGQAVPPYGVNLIVHRTNPRMQADLEVCVRQKVPIVITSLGAVKELVDAVHSYGGLVFHDVTNKRHAQKAISAGVDGLILVSAGAGGHAGTLNPIPFVGEVRQMFDGLILLGGCLSNGRDVATALQMGADLAYMGTRFINTEEAVAPPAYQEMIIESSTQDIVYTAALSGIHANFLKESLLASGFTEDLWDRKVKIDLGAELDVEAKAWKDIWSAGHGVATIHDRLPVTDLLARMRQEFREAIQGQQAHLQQYA